MGLHFSGEATVTKVRKPYKLTKERGRWTPEEHDRFLEALKLYGRVWPRIKEHVGTKNSVQIRSHAQKFFAKLEKKGHFRGTPRVEALDVEIPPPRPKRKSTNPYPRNPRPASPSSQPEIRDEMLLTPNPSFQTNLKLDFEKQRLHEKSVGEEQRTNENENHDNNMSEMGNLLHEESGSVSLADASFFSSMASLSNSCAFEGFLPSEKGVTDGDARQIFQHNDISKASKVQNCYASVEQLDKAQSCRMPGYEIQHTHNYPSYVAVNGLDGSKNIPLKENASSESRDNGMRCILQSSPDLQTPFIHLCHNPDDYIHASPTFSNLISCALLQNPAAHAAANLAAALWPAESAVCNRRCFCCMQLNSSPRTAAIAGVTAAAASAWWATHGLLPLTVSLHPALNCAPSVGNPVTTDGKSECFGKCQARSSVSKPQLARVSKGSIDQNVNEAKEDRGKGLLIFEHDDLNMEKWRKQIRRCSSCGSYATSRDEEPKEAEANTSSNEPANRKIESWKEVSQEGLLAFQAFYAGEVLPQSFLPQQDAATRETIDNAKQIEGGNVHSWLNAKCGCPPRAQSSERNAAPTGNKNVRDGKITIGVGQTNTRQTGFKPYKRCSTESTENRVATSKNYGEDNGSKRVRLEKKTSS